MTSLVFILLKIIKCVCVCVSIWAYAHEYNCPWRSEEGGAGVEGVFESPKVNTGNPSQTFSKSNMCS